MKMILWKTIYYWVLIVLLSIKKIFKINLSDKIWYDGKIYVIWDGTRPGHWKLKNYNVNNGWVKRKYCKKVKTIHNFLNSFKFGYKFYMGYWFDIWRKGGIKSWMRKCKIW